MLKEERIVKKSDEHRRMGRVARTAMSVALSAAMVIGGIPTPALSEALEEAALTQQSAATGDKVAPTQADDGTVRIAEQAENTKAETIAAASDEKPAVAGDEKPAADAADADVAAAEEAARAEADAKARADAAAAEEAARAEADAKARADAAAAEEAARAEADAKAKAEADAAAQQAQAAAVTQQAQVAGATVSATYPSDAFSSEVTLRAEAIVQGDARYSAVEEKLSSLAAADANYKYNKASAFDISFVNAAGSEVEPTKPVQVSIALAAPLATEKVTSTNLVHVDDNGSASVVAGADVKPDGSAATFEASSFSVYVVTAKQANGNFEVGDTDYETLQAAINSLEGKSGTVTVAQSIVAMENITIPAGTSVALRVADGVEYTIQGDVTVRGSLELNDGITIKSSNSSAVDVKNGGSLVMNGGSISTVGAYGLYFEREATLAISGGEISGDDSAIFGYGTIESISGGVFRGTSAGGGAGMKLLNGAYVGSISGGSFRSNGRDDGDGILMMGATIDSISGGEFLGGTLYNTYPAPDYNGYGVKIGTDSTIHTISGGTFKGSWPLHVIPLNDNGEVVTITGGQFIGNESKSIALQVDRGAHVNILGGEFSGRNGISNFGVEIVSIQNATIDAKYNGILNYSTCGDISNATITSQSGSGICNTSWSPLNEIGTIGTISNCTIKVTDENGDYGIENCAEENSIAGIQGGTISSMGSAAVYNLGTIGTISGDAAISYDGPDWYDAVQNMGSGTIDKIEGGTFSSKDGYALKNRGTVNRIEGGTFSVTGESHAVYNDGTIGEIAGGTFTAENGGYYGFRNGGTINTISGGAFRGSAGNTGLMMWGSEPKVGTISGGEFSSAGGYGVWNYGGAIDAISGGTYSGQHALLNYSSVGTITGGTYTGTSCGIADYGEGASIGSIAIEKGTASVISGGDASVWVHGGATLGAIAGYGVFCGPLNNDTETAIPLEHAASDALDLTKDSNKPAMGNGRYSAANLCGAWDFPEGYHMSKSTFAADGVEGEFHALIRDNVVIYNGNGHATAYGDTVKTLTYENGKATLANNVNQFQFTLGNNKFLGWNTKADGTGTSYAAGDEVDLTQLGGELVLYAQWGKFTLTLDSDGGTLPAGSSETMLFEKGETLAGLPTPTKAGSAFEGWFDRFGNEKTSSSTMPGFDLTLKARWKEHTITVNHYVDTLINRYPAYMGISGGAYEVYNPYYKFDKYSVATLLDAAGKEDYYLHRFVLAEGETPKIGARIRFNDYDYILSKVTVNDQEVTDLTSVNYTLDQNNVVKFYYSLIPIEIRIDGYGYTGTYDGETHNVSGFNGELIHGGAYMKTGAWPVTEASDGAELYRVYPKGWLPEAKALNVGTSEALPWGEGEWQYAEQAGWKKDGDAYIVPESFYTLYYSWNQVRNMTSNPWPFVLKFYPGKINVKPADMTLAVAGYEGTYDGAAHGPSVSATGINGTDLLADPATKVEYSTDGGATWSANAPSITDAGRVDFVARVTNPNYNAAEATGALEVKPADMTVNVSGYEGTYDGAAHGPSVSATGINGTDLLADPATKVEYSTDGGATWTVNVPSITDAGKVDFRARVTNPNYNAAEATGTLEVRPADITLAVSGYEGTYDGTAHGPSVSATGINGTDLLADPATKVEYSTDGGATWTGNAPSITDAGKVDFRARVTNPNYGTAEATGTLEARPADITLAVSGYEGTYDGAEHKAAVAATGINGTNLLADPATKVEYSTDGGATWSANAPSITDAGRVDFVARVTNPNYNAAEATGTLKVAALYEVTFDADGAETAAPEKQIVVEGGHATAPASDPTKTGHGFRGWHKVTDAVAGTVADDAFDFANTAITENTVLKAKWEANRYSVTFDGNGADTGAMDAQYFTYGTEQALAENGFSRQGYTFAGWNTAVDGTGTAYADKQQVGNLTADDGATVKLYAQWSKVVVPTPEPKPEPTPAATDPTNEPAAQTPAAPAPAPASPAAPITDGLNAVVTFVTQVLPAPAADNDATPAPIYVFADDAVAAAEETVAEDGTPLAAPVTETVAEDGTPLAGAPVVKTWALVNLLCAIATAALSLVLALGLFGKRRNDKDSDEADEQQIKRHRIARLTSVVIAVASIVVFVLTEDLSGIMCLLDKWTLLMAAILVAQIVVAVKARKSTKDEKDEGGQPTSTATA